MPTDQPHVCTIACRPIQNLPCILTPEETTVPETLTLSTSGETVDVPAGTATRTPTFGGRWVHLCQDCWALGEPDQYFPEGYIWDECAVCGQEGLTVNAHPSIARAAYAAQH